MNIFNVIFGVSLGFPLAVMASSISAQEGAAANRPATGQPQSALPAGGALEGEFVFEKCATCHLPTGSSKTGPDLSGVAGRVAAHLDDFSYSPAMKDAAAKGLVWDDATLDRYLADPKAAVPGTNMNAKPLPDPQDRADVIAYLKTL